MSNPLIAYISLWFPKPSETFIFREVLCLRGLGARVKVFTLYGPLRKHLSPEMEAFSPEVERLGIASFASSFGDYFYWKRKRPEIFKRLWATLPILRWGNLERTGENLWAFHSAFRLARRFEALGVSHIHSPWAGGACTAAQTASALTGIPYSFAARAGDIHPPEPALVDKVAQAAFIRVNNAFNVPYLQSFAPDNPDKVRLVYNALTLKERVEAPAAMRPPYRLLAMGRFVRTKGFDVLLNACRLLRDQDVDFRLALVGEGSWGGRLKRLTKELGLADVVEYPGFVSHERVARLMAEADLFITPSVVDPTGDRDGIPNVIMEAMVNAVPVLATDVAGIKEVVRDRDTGRLAPQRDPAALARAMRDILSDREGTIAMARRGRDLVLSLFDQEKNCRRLLGLFEEHAVGDRP